MNKIPTYLKLIQNKYLRVFVVIVILIFMISTSVIILQQSQAPQLLGKAVWCVDTNEKVIALTFDDGPDFAYTPQILALLNKYDAKATFFVVGINVKGGSDLIKDAFMKGNEIGNHSWNHHRLIFRSLDFIEKQIQQTDQAIRATGYKGKIYFRAPYGTKLFILPYILSRRDRYHILWNITVIDRERLSTEGMFEIIKEGLSPGDIILLHEGSGDKIIELLDMILQDYTTAGYRFVTISELLSYQQ